LLRSPAAPGPPDLCECVKASPSLERRRREQLRRRAANRSRARRITRSEQAGKVRFSVLAVCLTVTVVVVVVSMFEALGFLMA
jgi:hypothetical protein